MLRFVGLIWRIARSIVYRTGLENFRLGSISMRRAKGRVQETLARVLATTYRWPATVHGHQMYLSTGPGDFAVDMLLGSFEEGTTALFERGLRPGMCAIDLGAHIGYFTLLAARLVGPTGKVYAFEPAPATYRILQKNIALNGYHHVVAVQKAVADHSGTMMFHLLNEAGSPSNTLYEDARYDYTSVAVEVTTLDEFLENQGWPHVDLVKMDIEGAEFAALAGMRALLERQSPAPVLIVEFSPDALARSGVNPRKFLATFSDRGFRTRFIMGSEIVDAGDVDVEGLSVALHGGSRVNLLCERPAPVGTSSW